MAKSPYKLCHAMLCFVILPYPLPYPTLPYSTLPYPILSHPVFACMCQIFCHTLPPSEIACGLLSVEVLQAQKGNIHIYIYIYIYIYMFSQNWLKGQKMTTLTRWDEKNSGQLLHSFLGDNLLQVFDVVHPLENRILTRVKPILTVPQRGIRKGGSYQKNIQKSR